MSRAMRAIIFSVAAALVAALFTTVSAVQPTASAASFSVSVPGFTWQQVEGPPSLGSDRCWFTASTLVSDDSSLIAGVAALQKYDISYERSGYTLTLKSSLFRCDTGTTGPISNVSLLASGKNNVAIWILGGAVGAAIGVAAALFGAPVVAAAAAAAGVTLSSSAAGIIAGCLGGAIGGAVGEYIKGNTAPKMATSAILNCAGGTIVGLFKSQVQAAEAVAEAAIELASLTEAEMSAAVSRVTSEFNTQLAGLTAEAATVADQAVPLESAVRAAMSGIASS